MILIQIIETDIKTDSIKINKPKIFQSYDDILNAMKSIK